MGARHPCVSTYRRATSLGGGAATVTSVTFRCSVASHVPADGRKLTRPV